LSFLKWRRAETFVDVEGAALEPMARGPASAPRFSISGALGAFRGRMASRIREINGMTEREVLSAGESVHTIVGSASAHVDQIKKVLSGLTGDIGNQQASGVTATIAEQSAMLREHVTDMTTRAAAQDEFARSAQAQSGSILATAGIIAKLAREAKTLALNARIEAARSEDHADGFGVIAAEMQRLANEVASANTRVQDWASKLSLVLPAVAEQAREIRAHVDAFASSSTLKIAEVESGVAQLRDDVARTLRASDETIESILRASREALSHLQFQDVAAQSIMQVDAWIRDIQVAAAKSDGDGVDTIAPPMHTELGGGKTDVSAVDAGEIMMF
jgi:methyl-accepting chemotaxis protein